ncbi:MAG: TIGR01777 family protein [Saprospiraceae bacterium]|nr:TIGR01777 family protein [Saprospiraceae bacterium]
MMEVQRSKILITGGTGLIGQSLKNSLIEQKNEVNILSRQSADALKSRYAWDPKNHRMDAAALLDTDVIVNLAGSSIAGGLWTRPKKKQILQSRLDAIRTLSEGLRQSNHRPRLIIQASAIGIYGHRPGEYLDENSSLGIHGFLTETVKIWEKESEVLSSLTEHLVHIRIGLVFGKSGGIWPLMTMSSKMGFLSWFGSGEQFYSWIHLDDVVKSISFIIQQKTPAVVYNLTAPNAVSQKTILQIAAKKFPNVFLSFGIPDFLMRLVPFGMSELVMTDAKIYPGNLLLQNYPFVHSEINDCIQCLLQK